MPPAGPVIGVLLAAGAGARFGDAGGPKALAEVAGRQLYEWPLAALREGGVDDVVVVVGAEPFEPDGAAVVRCDDWAEGIAASLRCGVAWAARERGADAVVIALADQPLLDGRAVARVLAARAPGTVAAVRATYDGVPNHPTVIESSLFAAVAQLRGDQGARPLLGDARLVLCDGLGAPDDVDTPADLARVDRLRRPA
ncbi:MAG TPA: NTP transferase domain-containing protein [Baekduia sp.]|uniref:nucleotidyltransferase family protein n=1 Tax=Baekduia sp. TaxID=2600305 RepID=UPI002D774BB1|nr:NTP transferase domain-containing protein [Baekduia sp.]HET6506246.1 NTP transferase domain-containing protein [Baekduia sp.]